MQKNQLITETKVHPYGQVIELSCQMPLIFCRILSGNLAKAQGIRNCVSSNTVCTMDSSGYFTSRIKAGDDIAVGIKHFGVAVNLQTAHSMMDCR